METEALQRPQRGGIGVTPVTGSPFRRVSLMHSVTIHPYEIFNGLATQESGLGGEQDRGLFG